MNQRVLVFPVQIIVRLGYFQGYTFGIQKYLPTILDPNNNSFMDRVRAEQDFLHKQLISYVILRFGDLVYNYVRGEQIFEDRLVAKRSIGLGGHIEPKDNSLPSFNKMLYYEAAKREVSEEVELKSDYVERIIALVNDDSDEVGKVHFGIVHIWDLDEPKVKQRENKITKGGFATIDTLNKEYNQLESWSRITLEILNKLKK